MQTPFFPNLYALKPINNPAVPPIISTKHKGNANIVQSNPLASVLDEDVECGNLSN